MTNPHSSISATSYSPYDLLRVYTYYRTLLGSLLLLMFQAESASRLLGGDNPDLFFYTALIYTGINVVTLALLWKARFQPSQDQLLTLLVVDVVAITLMMYCSGGAGGGLGYLLVVSVAAGGMLLLGQLPVLLAAIATIAVIVEGSFRMLVLVDTNQAMVSSGFLGVLIFVTAFAFRYLARKVRSSNEEAQAQAMHAAYLQRLAQMIVERMRTGIIVLTPDNDIALLNEAAADLLGLPEREAGATTLDNLAGIMPQIQHWRSTGSNESPIVRVDSDYADEVRVSFARLDPERDSDTLIFLEDNRAIAQKAQQLKLASLGRLTASIAHEIRNPLGAISHASQLLGESDAIHSGDRRLLEIVNNHCRRVNQIIENVLQLSRRRSAQPQHVQLNTWLDRFVDDYRSSKREPVSLRLRCLADTIVVKFDPGQLQQVLTNLCDNGLRHSEPVSEGQVAVTIEAGIDHNTQRPYIDIIDSGPGIDGERLKHVFEPFFTTESSGSGLGLYLCKELCEANQAVIHYTRTASGESCFHIQLAHPERAL